MLHRLSTIDSDESIEGFSIMFRKPNLPIKNIL